MSKRLEIRPERCDGCIGCVRSCPTGALEVEQFEDSGRITWDAGRCIFCRRCEAVCPKDAVAFSEFDLLFGPRAARVPVMDLTVTRCSACGRPFALHGGSSETRTPAMESDRLALCPRCRQRATVQAQIAKKGEPAS